MGNLALYKFADSSSYVYPFTPAKAVNGTATVFSRWLGSCLPTMTQPINWYRVDLNGYYWINRWVVKQMGAVNWPVNFNMSDYKLQGSLDNTNWFDIDLVVNNSANVTDRTFTAKQVRWVKVCITKGLRNNPSFASIVDFEVYEAPPTSCYLSNLTLSAGTLNPPFVKTTAAYTAEVGFASSVAITPTAEDPNAKITVNGVTVQSGSPATIQLNVGLNSIPVVVTPVIGVPFTYTIAITRNCSAYLSSLTLSSGTLNPSFTGTGTSYTANVGYASSVTVTPTAEDPSATVTVNGNPVSRGASAAVPLNVGVNNVLIAVTPVSGTPVTYTIAVTRTCSAYLDNLTLSSGTLNPPFSKTLTAAYTANVGYDTTGITLTPTADDPAAIVKVNGTVVPSGQPSGIIGLNVGANPIPVEVTAADGSKVTYNVTVTRASNPYLSNIQVYVGTKTLPFTQTFSSNVYNYKIDYTGQPAITSIKIKPTAVDSGASITVNGSAVASGALSVSINISVGTITVLVNSATGSDQKQYVIDCTRT